MHRTLNFLNPFDYVSLAFQQQKLAMASVETVWHRSSQMAAGTMTPSESVTMWAEKPTALAKGFERASIAAVAGKSPVQVMHAAMAPMTAKARSNARRLRK